MQRVQGVLARTLQVLHAGQPAPWGGKLRGSPEVVQAVHAGGGAPRRSPSETQFPRARLARGRARGCLASRHLHSTFALTI